MSACLYILAKNIPCGVEQGARAEGIGGALSLHLLSRNILGLGASKRGWEKKTYLLYLYVRKYPIGIEETVLAAWKRGLFRLMIVKQSSNPQVLA